MARKRRPALSADDREKQMIGYAVDLAEKMLIEGTAPPSVIQHYLRLGSPTHQLEKEALIAKNQLLRAKAEAIQKADDLDKLFKDAMDAIGVYRGSNDEDL